MKHIEVRKILEANKEKYSERHIKAIEHCIKNNIQIIDNIISPDVSIETIKELYIDYIKRIKINKIKKYKRKYYLDYIEVRKLDAKETITKLEQYSIDFKGFEDTWIQECKLTVFDNYRKYTKEQMKKVAFTLYDYILGFRKDFKHTLDFKNNCLFITKQGNNFFLTYQWRQDYK